MLEKLFKSFDIEEDPQLKREIMKLKADNKHVWHLDETETPEDDGRYLIFCRVGKNYRRAIADAELAWTEFDGEETIWTVDRFLTMTPVGIGDHTKVIAWSELNEEDYGYDD